MDDNVVVSASLMRTIVAYALGYVVFLLAMRQANPFSKPKELTARPRWLLSLWTFLAIGAVFSAPVVNANDWLDFVIIKMAFFLLAMTMGIAVYFTYKRVISRKTRQVAKNHE